MSSHAEPGNGFHPRRLGHVNLYVGELERSMDFYIHVCGLEEVFRERAIKAGFVSNGTRHHDIGMVQVTDDRRIGREGVKLTTKLNSSSPGLNHLAFEIDTEAELVDWFQEARAAGVHVVMTLDHGLAHSVYVLDPAGNEIEFYSDTMTNWRPYFTDALERNEIVTGQWKPGEGKPSTNCFYDPNPEIRRVGEALLHPLSIFHAAIAVPNFEETVRFYSGIGGLQEAAKVDGEIAVMRGRIGNPDLTIIAASGTDKTGIHHATFRLGSREELESGERRLAEAGIPVARHVSTPSKNSIVIADPDGLELEFAHYTSSEFDGSNPPKGELARYWV